ncbi:MAG: 4Fe-4S binding protein [Curvibacter sp.]|nr:MAG: 4Fe-4S binding protein [Curvibacter sp.]
MNRWSCRDCCSRPRVTVALERPSGAVKTRSPGGGRSLWPWLASLFLWALAGLTQAGVMDRAAMEKAFPSPLIVGEKASDLPVWPILKQDATATPVVAYAFESIDLAPLPGFSGTPFNLLVLLDAKGRFMDVRVLSQHEPVFLDGLGEAPMHAFVEQYKGLSLTQNIRIGAPQGRGDRSGSNVSIDGVAKATASVRILNQSLLSSSLKVARARLGFGEGRDPDLIAHIRTSAFQALDWAGLQKAGLVARHRFLNRDIEQAFAGTLGEGQDPQALASPDGRFVDLHFAWLSVPAVGRNLLSPADWEALNRSIEPGDHALLLLADGRYSMLGEDFVRGAVPDRLTLQQQKLPLEMRDLDTDLKQPLQVPESLRGAEWRVFRVIGAAGLDPSQPLDFGLQVTRSKGAIYPEKVRRSFEFSARLPEAYVEAGASDSKTWHSIWRSRAWELAVLALGLVVLAVVLSRPERLSRHPQRLRWFRNGYLLFTLGFIGWFAQGQLSVVNFTALLQALLARRSLDFFLYDPMTVSLWAFVALSFVLWGRGTFCGWLCPFGALQELSSQLARRLGLRARRVPERWDRRLKRVKHGVLIVILISACLSVTWTDRLVEVEPFKTSITLNFVRAWPYVLWALALVGFSAFFYKGYCRYLCPLGAGMVWLGRLRRLDWIARRSECGQPCQRCRSDCAYQAIERSGRVDYDECFQCLDCVVIYESDSLCVPRIQQQRQPGSARVIPLQPAPIQEETP